MSVNIFCSVFKDSDPMFLPLDNLVKLCSCSVKCLGSYDYHAETGGEV